jgi:hypothetical protein
MARVPYQPGDTIHGEYRSKWGPLAGTGTVQTVTPAGANRWTVTARVGREDLGEAETVAYTVNSRGRSLGAHSIRPVTEAKEPPTIPTPDELATRMNTLYADHREDLDRLTALEKLWVDGILPMYPTNPPAARALWDEAASIAIARDLERRPTPPTPKEQS